MNPDKYPNLSFKLDSGRRVQVDAFIWEPSCLDTIEIQDGNDIRQVVVERKRIWAEKLIGNRKTHHMMPRYIDQYSTRGFMPRIQNTSMTALLSSSPISGEALYSELVIIFYMDHIERSSVESMLERELHDFEWDDYAEDIYESTNELWKQVWLEKTVH